MCSGGGGYVITSCPPMLTRCPALMTVCQPSVWTTCYQHVTLCPVGGFSLPCIIFGPIDWLRIDNQVVGP
jgi:hypothetical protein